MTEQIFYFDKLTKWEKITIISYLCLTGILIYFFLCINSDSSNRALLLFYTLGTQFFLYLLNYGSLRNLTVYLIWTMFSLGHLYLYYQLKDNPGLQNFRGHAATGLRNTIICLLLFQLLRVISIKTQKKELVAPSKGSRTDVHDGRRITIVDYVLFVVYLGTTIYLNFKNSAVLFPRSP